MKRALLLCLPLLAGKLMAALTPEAKSNTFHHTNDGFAITLPAGWVRLPAESMQTVRQVLNERSRVPAQGLVSVYQFETNAQPLEPPFVMVQVMKTGRVSDFLMRRLVQTKDIRGEVTPFLRAQGLFDSSLRSMNFDTNRFTLTIDAVQSNEQGRHRALTKVFFTEDGAITIGTAATELDFPKWQATLQQIVESVRLDEPARYKLRPPPDLSSGWRDWAIFGVVIGGIALFWGAWIYWTRIRGPSTLEY